MAAILDDAAAEFRREVREFLRAHLPSTWKGVGALSRAEHDTFLATWRETLCRQGYLGLTWPVEYGGHGLGVLEHAALTEEFVKAGVPVLPLPSDPLGFSLLGPTLLHWGSEEQKQRFLPKLISGEHRWAQGYSEPEAGSDLFAVRTRASEVDGQWIVNGQKCWQTAGDSANWIFILARTEPDAPKARGLSLLLVPIDQPGIEVRPIRTMTGEVEFCEFHFNGARTPSANIVGPRGAGAKVALTLLGYERAHSAAGTYAEHRIELDRLIDLVLDAGRDTDDDVRQRVAWCHSKVEMLKFLAEKTLAAAAAGSLPGPESSILKLYQSEYHCRVTELAMDVLGMAGIARSEDEPVGALGVDPRGTPNSSTAWQTVYLRARAGTIYGGSSQIQRNTLAERVLGLPRESTTTGRGGRS